MACGKDPAGLEVQDGSDSGAETGPATTTGDPTTSSTSDADGDGSTAGAMPPLYDVGTIPDVPGSACGDNPGGPGGQVEFSYIWIANSAQGTISKINTVSMEEEGRYQAKPSNGDPSRTSVSLTGNVVVANRNGGLAKFYANPADCVESNGTPGIQTSTGAGDVLPWGEDECLAWYTDFTCSSNRPAAWTRGEWNEASCSYFDEKVWTACDDIAIQLNGDTGEVEHAVKLNPEMNNSYNFIYGGAADADGNFWALDSGIQRLYRVDGTTYDLQDFPLPDIGGYGITVDSAGRPWVCGGGAVARFNLDDSTWTSTGGWGGIGGCMTDGNNRIWHANEQTFGTVQAFDTETLDVVEEIVMPEYVHGVSVDYQGNVWGVSFAGNNAYRGDPVTDKVDTYSGLFGAYTYSDMTGVGLSSAGGGGTPQG
ncbi:MAG: hypothetical protein AAF721_17185 [Myxococcota bacterium]